MSKNDMILQNILAGNYIRFKTEEEKIALDKETINVLNKIQNKDCELSVRMHYILKYLELNQKLRNEIELLQLEIIAQHNKKTILFVILIASIVLNIYFIIN